MYSALVALSSLEVTLEDFLPKHQSFFFSVGLHPFPDRVHPTPQLRQDRLFFSFFPHLFFLRDAGHPVVFAFVRLPSRLLPPGAVRFFCLFCIKLFLSNFLRDFVTNLPPSPLQSVALPRLPHALKTRLDTLVLFCGRPDPHLRSKPTLSRLLIQISWFRWLPPFFFPPRWTPLYRR